jgi:hypothetical protein
MNCSLGILYCGDGVVNGGTEVCEPTQTGCTNVCTYETPLCF